MNRPIRRSTVRAFTLVELLVVISIIALLIAILVPTLSRARQQVRGVACRSNMKQLMNGMFYYVADYQVFPGTHGLFWMQNLFSEEWSRPAGVTWDGARDRIVNLTINPPYDQPYYLNPEFVADVPGKGTIFSYVKDPSVYTCPSDKPGKAENTPTGGGGNGRLSYSLNAYVGYQSPERLQSFKYVDATADNPLPDGHNTRDFAAGQHVAFPPAGFMTLFEEHPAFNMNGSFPDGNFNELDRIATRHMPKAGTDGHHVTGRTGIAFLDGHAEGRSYPAKTDGRSLFTEMGLPYYWRQTGPQDRANVSALIRDLHGPCPW